MKATSKEVAFFLTRRGRGPFPISALSFNRILLLLRVDPEMQRALAPAPSCDRREFLFVPHAAVNTIP